ncbi:hypothetical protein HDU98_007904 [Podochytrium sp. JEL0797]|nr:hypothetical protein HDU98_007904 [Podochytrium sp. JEL0797]
MIQIRKFDCQSSSTSSWNTSAVGRRLLVVWLEDAPPRRLYSDEIRTSTFVKVDLTKPTLANSSTLSADGILQMESPDFGGVVVHQFPSFQQFSDLFARRNRVGKCNQLVAAAFLVSDFLQFNDFLDLARETQEQQNATGEPITSVDLYTVFSPAIKSLGLPPMASSAEFLECVGSAVLLSRKIEQKHLMAALHQNVKKRAHKLNAVVGDDGFLGKEMARALDESLRGQQQQQQQQLPQAAPQTKQQTLFQAFGVAPPPQRPSMQQSAPVMPSPHAAQPLAAARAAPKKKPIQQQQQQQQQRPLAFAAESSAMHEAVLNNTSTDLRSLVNHSHALHRENLRHWLYPANKPNREYQFNIINASMFQNTLVALPTGLGKTFIAAVVMFNFYRWFPEGKIVFMAPTKPLVAQQIEACYKITGIPQEDTDEMTGQAKVENRRRSWAEKRVFFLTPQVMQNDLNSGVCPADKVVLLVIDEAHRASGKHAYCEVVRILTDEDATFRVLALTATPGADAKIVQNVINHLQISKIEIRTEDSLDIKPYTHERILDVQILPPSPEIQTVSKLFLAAIDDSIKRLQQAGVFMQDPRSASRYSIMQAKTNYMQRMGNAPNYTVLSDLSICMGLCESHIHLMHLGLRMFLTEIEAYTAETLNPTSKKSQPRLHLIQSAAYQRMLTTTRQYVNDDTTPSHPKLKQLVDNVVAHFTAHAAAVAAGNCDWQTRVMVFSNFRESVHEIRDELKKHEPLVKVMSFVGQSGGGKKGGAKGCTQKEQLELIEKFQQGGYNVLVATCIGEEGLDIGDVDLIVCYDAQNSPIRMLQRMGRTGRKRTGRVLLLLSEGKEEDAHRTSQAKYKTVQKAIMEGQGNKLTMFPVTREKAMFPMHVKPVVKIESLVIPEYDLKKKSVGGKVAAVGKGKKGAAAAVVPRHSFHHGSGTFLTDAQQREFERDGLDSRPFRAASLTAATVWQSIRLPTFEIGNGVLSRRFVKLMQLTETLAGQEETGVDVYNEMMEECLDSEDRRAIEALPASEWESGVQLGGGKVDEVVVVGLSEEEEEVVVSKRKRPKPKLHRLSNYDDVFAENLEDEEEFMDSTDLVMLNVGKKKKKLGARRTVEDFEDASDEDSNFYRNDSPGIRPVAAAVGAPLPDDDFPPLPPLRSVADNNVIAFDNDDDDEFAFMDEGYGDYDQYCNPDPVEPVDNIAAAADESVLETPILGPQALDDVMVKETPIHAHRNASTPEPHTDGELVPDTPMAKQSTPYSAAYSPTCERVLNSSPAPSFPIAVDVPDSPIAHVRTLNKWDLDGDASISPSPAPVPPHPTESGRFRAPDPAWMQDELCLAKGPRVRPAEFYTWPDFGFLASRDSESHARDEVEVVGGSDLPGVMELPAADFDGMDMTGGGVDEFDDDDMDWGEIDVSAIVEAERVAAAAGGGGGGLGLSSVEGTSAGPKLRNLYSNSNSSGRRKSGEVENSASRSSMKSMADDFSSPIVPKRKMVTSRTPLPQLPNAFSSPMESQMPFARRPQVRQRRVAVQEEEDDDDDDDVFEGTRVGKLRRKRGLEQKRDPNLSGMFDEEEEEGGGFDEDAGDLLDGMEDDGFAEPSSDVGIPTPMAIKVVRQRLQKKPRKAPKPRGSEPVILPKSSFPSGAVDPRNVEARGKSRKKVRISNVQHFFDEEVELSENDPDSGDESEGRENWDADLSGFINDDSYSHDVCSSPSGGGGAASAAESPGISMYHKSFISPRGGNTTENKLYDAMLNKYRKIEESRKSRPREEWEGFATQADAGADAVEFYDDPELADFVVDDDVVEFIESSPDIRPAKRRPVADKKPFHKPSASSSLNKEMKDSSRQSAVAPPAPPPPLPAPRIPASTPQHRKPNLAPIDRLDVTPISRIVADLPSSALQSSFDMDGPSPALHKVANLSQNTKELLYVDPGQENRHVEQLAKHNQDDRLCILVDNRENRAGIGSLLRSKFKCRVEFRQLAAGDYVLSNRVAVERKSRTDLVQSVQSRRIYDQLDVLGKMYAVSFLLVELEMSGPETVQQRNQFEGIIASLLRHKTKILFSQSRDDSAKIIHDLAQNEARQGLKINVPVNLPAKDSGIMVFLMSIPGISDATCIEIIEYGKFASLAEFLKCGSDQLLKRLPKSLTKPRAKLIAEHVQRQFDSNAAMGITL